MAMLVVRAGGVRILEFELKDAAVVVGRDAKAADIPVDDPRVSRRHAQIEPSDDGYLLRDLGSRNGVFIGGRRVGTMRLRDFDVFSVGHCEIEFRDDARPASSAASENTDLDTAVTDSPAARRGGAADETAVLRRLLDAAGAATSASDGLERVLDVCLAELSADAGFVASLDAEGDGCVVRAGRQKGAGGAVVRWDVPTPPRELVAAAAGAPLVVDDVAASPQRAAWLRGLSTAFRSLVAAPVRDGLGSLGVLVLVSARADAFRASLPSATAAATLVAPHLAAERARGALQGDLDDLRRTRSSAGAATSLVGAAPKFRELLERVEKTVLDVPAKARLSLLVLGETGAGKEALARHIHRESRRAKGPFVAVNAGAIVASLAESELFGVEEHVATGVKNRIGVIEQAEGGVLFLDEVGELTPDNQVRLLRVLQDGRLRRVGSEREIVVDAWVFAATNRDLAAEMSAKRFREDLYFRLNLLEFRVPPLRERVEDVPLLADAFRRRFSAEFGRHVESISEGAVERLVSYDWPGNVRELEHAVAAAVLSARSRVLGTADLPSAVAGGPTPRPRASPSPSTDEVARTSRTIEEVEREHIALVLAACGWKRGVATQRLGIARSTLDTKIEKYRLAPQT